jgi:hypothetical protein
MVTNNIHYIVLIFIIIIIFYISNFYIFNKSKIENFTDFLDLLDYNFNKKREINSNNNEALNNTLISNNEIKKTYIKKKMKHILIINKNSNYYFYDKHNKNYMQIKLLKKINIINYKNENIGNLISEKYNKLVFNIIFYKNNLNMEYIDNFNAIKLYLDNDDKIFYIKKNYNINKNNLSNNIYNIYLYALNIGKINYNSITSIYRINIYEEYKIYLNLIGLGTILLTTYI